MAAHIVAAVGSAADHAHAAARPLQTAAEDPVDDWRELAALRLWQDRIRSLGAQLDGARISTEGARAQPTLRVLDVCCGTGRWLQALAELVLAPAGYGDAREVASDTCAAGSLDTATLRAELAHDPPAAGAGTSAGAGPGAGASASASAGAGVGRTSGDAGGVTSGPHGRSLVPTPGAVAAAHTAATRTAPTAVVDGVDLCGDSLKVLARRLATLPGVTQGRLVRCRAQEMLDGGAPRVSHSGAALPAGHMGGRILRGWYDLVTCMHGLYAVPTADVPAVLRAMCAAATPGAGIAVVALGARDGFYHQVSRRLADAGAMATPYTSAEDVEAAAKSAGLTVVSKTSLRHTVRFGRGDDAALRRFLMDECLGNSFPSSSDESKLTASLVVATCLEQCLADHRVQPRSEASATATRTRTYGTVTGATQSSGHDGGGGGPAATSEHNPEYEFHQHTVVLCLVCAAPPESTA